MAVACPHANNLSSQPFTVKSTTISLRPLCTKRHSATISSPKAADRKRFMFHCTPTASICAFTTKAKATSASEDQSSVGDIVKIEAILPHCGGDARKPISYLLQLHAKKTHDPVSVSDTLYAIQRSFLQEPTSPSNPRDAGTPPPLWRR